MPESSNKSANDDDDDERPKTIFCICYFLFCFSNTSSTNIRKMIFRFWAQLDKPHSLLWPSHCLCECVGGLFVWKCTRVCDAWITTMTQTQQHDVCEIVVILISQSPYVDTRNQSTHFVSDISKYISSAEGASNRGVWECLPLFSCLTVNDWFKHRGNSR